LDKERLGTIRISSRLVGLQRLLRMQILVELLLLLAAVTTALGVSYRLQRIVSVPILALAHTARSIRDKRDYTLRAQKAADDEVGAAVDAFNQMLDRIQQGDAALRRASEELREFNATLELRIAERTAALEARATELKRSNDELESFAYVASHDLQEPLRAMSSYAQLLKRRFGERLGADADVYIEHILGGAARQRALIGALLDYSRVGRRPISPILTSTETVLDEALADLAALIRESGAQVMRGKLPDLPADRVELGQLFRNLLSNAIKFRGAEPPVVAVSALPVDDRWRFAFQDNGIGIDPKYFARIFVIFQRLHGPELGGTGIGLAVCKKIVERHGGTIWVESAPGKGSTFFFTLSAGSAPPAPVDGGSELG
jgi:light-regulated signal transduction histidine kinase (bacteriophytochrome)